MNALSRRLLILAAFVCPLASAAEPAKPLDPFEEGMREAYTAYKKGDHEAVTTKLRELLKIMEDKSAEKVGDVLPEAIEDWKGESLKRDELSTVGGGLSLSRTYVSKAKQEITVKVVKDLPLVKQLLPFFANEELLRLGNRKTHSVSGETAVMEGEKKLQLVVDKRIYVELVANDATSGEKELLGLARKLDLNALAKMK